MLEKTATDWQSLAGQSSPAHISSTQPLILRHFNSSVPRPLWLPEWPRDRR